MGVLECIVFLILGLTILALLAFGFWLEYRFKIHKQDQFDRIEEGLKLVSKQVECIQEHCIQEEARWSAGE